MDDRINMAMLGFVVWAFFLIIAVCSISVARTGSLESALMIIFAVFSSVIATEGVHEISGHRPIGTLKEFSAFSREELSLFNQRRIYIFNGVIHIIAGVMVSFSIVQRAFFSEDFVLVLFFESLITVAIMLALGSYWVNYGRFFLSEDGRDVRKRRRIGPALRTSFSLFVAIGASYGLALLFRII